MDLENTRSNTFGNAVLLVGISLVLGIGFDYLFFGKFPGIAFPIYVTLVVLGLFGTAAFFKKKLDNQVIWLLIPLGFFSLMVFVRSSGLLTFLNIVSSLLLLLLIARISFAERLKNFLVFDYIKILFLPLKFINPLFRTIIDLLAVRKTDNSRKILPQVVKGVIMTIPVLAIFLVLFSSADLIFQKYLSNLVQIDIAPETVFRGVLVLITTLAFAGAYSYIFRESHEPISEPDNKSLIGHIESAILLGSVNVLFFIFILLQLTYIFGGESNISSQGFTFAEYARRGFFELIAVGIISFLLLWSTEKYIVKKDSEHGLLFKLLSSALIVQVILMMGSAFKRLLLYEEAYGFTTLRLYSHAFIIFLGVTFCLLLYKIYRDKRESAFAFRIFMLTALFLASMNLLNPDAFIARRNIERFLTTGKLDTSYLGQLSDDAIPVTIAILNAPAENVKKNLARYLYWKTDRANSLLFSRWQSLNLSRMNAKKILQPRIHELEQYKNYQQKI